VALDHGVPGLLHELPQFGRGQAPRFDEEVLGPGRGQEDEARRLGLGLGDEPAEDVRDGGVLVYADRFGFSDASAPSFFGPAWIRGNLLRPPS